MSYFIHCLKNFANFSGRARRKEYWMFLLFIILFSILISILDSLLGTNYELKLPSLGENALKFGYLGMAFSLATFFPSLAVIIRRLHDINKSGWWIVVALIPCVGIFPFLYFMVKAGDTGDNQFGPDPKS